MKSAISRITALSFIAILGTCFSLPSHGQTFTGSAGVDGQGFYDYSNPANWSGGVVPNLTTGNTALINDGLAVTYEAGHAPYNAGDLAISNGGKLEISNGSWTQANGIAYIQLGQGGAGGNGTILVDGGTFNQGTASSTPFAITGTGNLFSITSGTANFSNSVNINAGLTFNLAGGRTNISGELDVNTLTAIMSGGILNTTLLTTVNSGGNPASFQFSGGTINFSSGTGIYGGSSDQINFTLGSTGTINFLATSAATVQGMVNSGIIQYNNATDSASFNVVDNGAGGAILTTFNSVSVPEPSTWAMLFGGLVLVGLVVRRRAVRA